MLLSTLGKVKQIKSSNNVETIAQSSNIIDELLKFTLAYNKLFELVNKEFLSLQQEVLGRISYIRGFGIDEFFSRKFIYVNNEIISNSRCAKLLYDYLEFDIDDKFVNRILIPVFIDDIIVSYIGYNPLDDKSKYINKNSIFFTRKYIFYNLSKQTLLSCYENGYVIVTEGIFDSIRLSSIGYMNNLATLGAFVSDEQVEFLAMLALPIVIVGDNDEAGNRAFLFITNKLEELAKKQQFKTKIPVVRIVPKFFKDIDEYIREDIKQYIEKHGDIVFTDNLDSKSGYVYTTDCFNKIVARIRSNKFFNLSKFDSVMNDVSTNLFNTIQRIGQIKKYTTIELT